MHVVIFEGQLWNDLAPITLTRPAFSLLSGASTLLEKQIRSANPTRLTLWVRPELEEMVKQRIIPTLSVPTQVNTPLDDEPATIIAGRMLHMSGIEQPDTDYVVMEDDKLIAIARTTMPGLCYEDVLDRTDKWQSLRELPQVMPQARFARSLCDFIRWNEEAIVADSIYWTEEVPGGSGIHMIQPDWIHARAGVKVAPGVVLDASNGPILLDDNSYIGANSVIEGPCYIGKQSRIQPLSHIRQGTSIGPVCRIGGEVSNSIFIGYSNKSHDGFLGDSYVGAWVNMGAGTVTSNLKSTYGPINMQIGSRKIPTDRQLMGSLIGDHVKTSIAALLPAGCYIGTGAVLATSQTLSPYIPSFVFWTDQGKQIVDLKKFAEIAERMMERRHIHFDEIEEHLLRYAMEAARTIEA